MKNADFETLLSMEEKERNIRKAEYFLSELGSNMLALSARYPHLAVDGVEERLLQEAEAKYGITKTNYDISIETLHNLLVKNFCKVRIKEKPTVVAYFNGMEVGRFEPLTVRERYGEHLIFGNGTGIVNITTEEE